MVDNDSSFRQRAVIKFLVKEEKSTAEIHLRLQRAYGDVCMGASSVRRWVKHFEDGNTSIQDNPDLAPSDYHLSGSVKEQLRGQRYETLEDIRKAVRQCLREDETDFYSKGIFKLTEWRKNVCKEMETMLKTRRYCVSGLDKPRGNRPLYLAVSLRFANNRTDSCSFGNNPTLLEPLIREISSSFSLSLDDRPSIDSQLKMAAPFKLTLVKENFMLTYGTEAEIRLLRPLVGYTMLHYKGSEDKISELGVND
ncbi:hypothetical protein ANN_02702 [Periplaneta americana]|uniref:Mos1 transposase HTH domain-containing protein n=1 Tax=Periplaneta americana TaxID=6978 RepID=A0ABQ8TWZ4_PERAM|nr:hypothetical protein ANN_02702 [Periplaneta americana]